jgi:thiol-disulfide isomerase/thioredoxin
MKCPVCKRRVLSFWRFGVRDNALSHPCPHCYAELSGGRVVHFLVWALLFTFLLCITVAIIVRNDRPISWSSPYLLLLVGYLPAWLIAFFFTWLFGEYRLTPPTPAALEYDKTLSQMAEEHLGVVTTLSAATLDAFISSHHSVVIHLWAPWNGHDRMYQAKFKQLAGAYPDVRFASMNYDEEDNRHAADKIVGKEILSSPLLLWFADGNLERKSHGATSLDTEWLQFRSGLDDL